MTGTRDSFPAGGEELKDAMKKNGFPPGAGMTKNEE